MIGTVNTERLGRIARMLRVRQRLTQVELARRAGVSRRAVATLERDGARRLPAGTVERILGFLGARVEFNVFWNGPELDRMLDAGHAALGAAVKRRLERWGWMVRVEVSYSRYGERGRIDLVAWHQETGLLLVVELKTDLVDVQALLGTLDAKSRLGRHVAEQLGWRVRAVVPAIVFTEDRTTRYRLQRFATLFDRYSLRGRAAISWLRRPVGTPSGLLWISAIPGRVTSRSSAPRVRPGRPETAAPT
jgi:transcriptional regulator with XRE-family HTH domain